MRAARRGRRLSQTREERACLVLAGMAALFDRAGAARDQHPSDLPRVRIVGWAFGPQKTTRLRPMLCIPSALPSILFASLPFALAACATGDVNLGLRGDS